MMDQVLEKTQWIVIELDWAGLEKVRIVLSANSGPVEGV